MIRNKTQCCIVLHNKSSRIGIISIERFIKLFCNAPHPPVIYAVFITTQRLLLIQFISTFIATQ